MDYVGLLEVIAGLMSRAKLLSDKSSADGTKLVCKVETTTELQNAKCPVMHLEFSCQLVLLLGASENHS